MDGKIVFAVLSVLLLLAACAPKAAAPKTMPPAPAATEAAVSSIETTSNQVDQLDKEFDTSNIDKLDQDLASIDNLDLG